MAEYQGAHIRTFTSGEALEAGRGVLLSSSTVIYADSSENAIGVTTRKVADETPVAVAMFGPVVSFEASAAVTAGAVVYLKDDGKVDDADAGSDEKLGVALEAATASGDIISVVIIPTLA